MNIVAAIVEEVAVVVIVVHPLHSLINIVVIHPIHSLFLIRWFHT